ncbi:MAG: hypothetical protein JWQ74_530 [Marmoricola sp.]|nr:hypothetical protein [Marmoricola sp.]
MSSSSEAAPVVALPDLRTGAWTRFGAASILGDPVTEQTLSTLAESTRAAARAQGYSVGWAEGQRAAREAARIEAEDERQARSRAEAARAAEHHDAIAALELAATRLHESVASSCAAIEQSASTLAWELTQELVGHELISADGADVVRRVLALLPTGPVARVRLHPADVAGAEEIAAHGVTVVPDPSLQRGDALVEAADHVLDLRLDTALERVRAVLLGGEPR